MSVNLKLISDGDIAGALLVTDEKYNVDIFLVLVVVQKVFCSISFRYFGCNFQGRFIFDNEKDKIEQQKWG